jgi:predicted unusual protein kinase regulating ubiquinone biosynthesis (AarF/ABC1/UbiB family)
MTHLVKQYFKTTLFAKDVGERFSKHKRILKSDGEWLKHRLQDMGPTYVKIGQFVSTRRDIFDTNIVDALRDLQDRVRPIEAKDVRDVMTKQLPLDKFLEIEMAPIASASIGQVHRAVLNNKKKQKVVIKVKRPGIDNMIKSDVHILSSLLQVMEMSGSLNVSESRDLLDDFRDFVLLEADYENEARNIKAFCQAYAPNPDIIIPRVHESLSTDSLIVMDYVPSTKFSVIKNRLTKEQRSELAYKLMDMVVRQFISDGIVHGDPHEGNIGVSDSGKLVIYDLGNIITIEPALRSLMKQFIFEVMIENIDAAIDVMKRINLIEIRDDSRLRVYLEKYVQYIKTIDVKVFNMSDKEVFQKLPVKFDGVIFRLIRVFGIIEGICKDLDPSFNYNTVFVKYLDMLLLDNEFIDYKIRSDIKSLIIGTMKTLKL